jgi:hypothetical protein
MAAVGFRCEPREVHWVVMDGTRGAPVVVEKDRMRVPQNMARPAELSWLLREIAELLVRTSPAAVGYKRSEASPRPRHPQRLEAEAIVQVAAHDAGVPEICGLLKRRLKSAIHYDGDARYVTRAVDEAELEGLGNSLEEKEAALAAWSLLPEE